MSDEEILFIGGPYDGKRKKWNSPLATQLVLTMTLGEPLEDRYTLQKFFGKGEFFIAVHEGETNPMKRLVEGYKRP